jgi:hypothetical protein
LVAKICNLSRRSHRAGFECPATMPAVIHDIWRLIAPNAPATGR